MKRREFENILEECLEQVLAGTAIEKCLARYPEQADELEPLLQTALAARKATTIKPRSEFRERARYQFRSALREREVRESPRTFSWRPQWAAALITILALLVAFSGTAAMASNSMPDEPLYPVKIATETIRLTLTPSALGKAELYARLADERVNEIVTMAEKGKPEKVEQAAERLNNQLIAMASLAAPAAESGDAEETSLLSVPAPTPAPEPSPGETPVPSVVEQPRKIENGPVMAPPLRPAPVTPPEATPAPAEMARSNRGREKAKVKADKRTELRGILEQHAAENSETLNNALEKVPESAKNALREAIELSDSAYERALKSLD